MKSQIKNDFNAQEVLYAIQMVEFKYNALQT